jgi:hypothetical protein
MFRPIRILNVLHEPALFSVCISVWSTCGGSPAVIISNKNMTIEQKWSIEQNFNRWIELEREA